MAQKAVVKPGEEFVFSGLINRLSDPEFIRLFAENPQVALNEVGIQMDLAEFTDELSKNQKLYKTIVQKISEKVDVTKLTVAANTCCS